MIAKLQVTKGKSRLIGLHQIFNLLCFQGYCQDSEKTTHHMGGNIYKLSDKGLGFRIYKNSYKAVFLKRQNTEKWVEDLNRHSSKEDIQMTSTLVKDVQCREPSGKRKSKPLM